jgi:hypothetical protein
MKATMNRLFSLSAAETEYLYNKQDKIELMSCPRNAMICQGHLAVVNKCYVESEQSFRDKNFQRSIETLKDAFYKTTELVDAPCNKCARLFRSTITESLENMSDELEKMTRGLFGNKRYHSCYLNAASVLNEFEKVRLHESFQSNELHNRFIGSQLKRKVS